MNTFRTISGATPGPAGSLQSDALHELGARAAQQAGELVFGERIGHRRYRAEHGRRIGAQRHRERKRFTRAIKAVVAKIERAAAMRAASA